MSVYLWCLQDGAFAFFHDLAVTDNYYVLLQNPTRLDFRKLLFDYCVGAFYILSCFDLALECLLHCTVSSSFQRHSALLTGLPRQTAQSSRATTASAAAHCAQTYNIAMRKYAC